MLSKVHLVSREHAERLALVRYFPGGMQALEECRKGQKKRAKARRKKLLESFEKRKAAAIQVCEWAKGAWMERVVGRREGG